MGSWVWPDTFWVVLELFSVPFGGEARLMGKVWITQDIRYPCPPWAVYFLPVPGTKVVVVTRRQASLESGTVWTRSDEETRVGHPTNKSHVPGGVMVHLRGRGWWISKFKANLVDSKFQDSQGYAEKPCFKQKSNRLQRTIILSPQSKWAFINISFSKIISTFWWLMT